MPLLLAGSALTVASCALAIPKLPQDAARTAEPTHRTSGGVEFGYALGKVRYETHGTTLDDTGDGHLIRGRIEGAIPVDGPTVGVAVQVLDSDDDLLDEFGVPSEPSMLEANPYLAFAVGSERGFWMPIRVGYVYNRTELDFAVGQPDIEWDSHGGRVEAEPSVRLYGRDGFSIGLYGRAAAALASTSFSVGTTDFDTESWLFGLEGGVRIEVGSVLLRAGFVDERFKVEDVDGSLPAVELGFGGVVFQGGIRF